jgi:mannose-6-phosphate isomerase-like protein (cupin superfamily)
MAERVRMREREREATAQSAYELAVRYDREFAERQLVGRVVLRLEDCPQEQTRQGLLRPYLDPFAIKDTPLRHWAVFTHEIKTKSGKHRHQGGLVIYVIEGRGYSIVDGDRVDWEKGDLVLLPLRQDGVEHQHFNLDKENPALWIAFIHFPLRDHVASEITQTEVSPEFASGGFA